MPKIPIKQRELGPSGRIASIKGDPQAMTKSFQGAEMVNNAAMNAFGRLGSTAIAFQNKKNELNDRNDIMSATNMAKKRFAELHRSQMGHQAPDGSWVDPIDDRDMDEDFAIKADQIEKDIMSNTRLSKQARQDIKTRLESIRIGETVSMHGIQDVRAVKRLKASNDVNANDQAVSGDLNGARQVIMEGVVSGLYGEQEGNTKLRQIEYVFAVEKVKQSGGSTSELDIMKENKEFQFLQPDDYNNLKTYANKLTKYRIEQLNDTTESQTLEAIRKGQYNVNDMMTKLDIALESGANPKLITQLKDKVKNGDVAQTSAAVQSEMYQIETAVALGRLTPKQAKELFIKRGIIAQATAKDYNAVVSDLNKWANASEGSTPEQLTVSGRKYLHELDVTGILDNRKFKKINGKMVDVTADEREKQVKKSMKDLDDKRTSGWFWWKKTMTDPEFEEIKTAEKTRLLETWDKQDRLYNSIVAAISNWSKEPSMTSEKMEGNIRKLLKEPLTGSYLRSLQREFFTERGITPPDVMPATK